ncbi:MAG: 3-phosphoshikimate 1-carboxyvinyltransferase [Elusimicrobia bacterium]|nr:3-phosphoshikimate 1-carboxyvinyltransferase [Elusimicrobiota bacterium]
MQSLLSSGKRIVGEWTPPPDKSITHRAIFLASLSTQKSEIRNPLFSGDCLSSLNAFRSLGVELQTGKEKISVSSGKKSRWNPLRRLEPSSSPIHCGNSGTTMRLLAGVLSGQPFKSRLVGDRSLSQRPMKRVTDPLTRMGAEISAREGRFAPLVIQGREKLKPIFWKSPVASAQVKSSILLAGLFAEGTTTVQEPSLSRDHTERMLRGLGVPITIGRRSRSGYQVSVQAGSGLEGLDLTVPGDFSSAAFLIASAILAPRSEMHVRAVNLNPTRTGLLNVLKRMGAQFSVQNKKEIFGEPVGDIWVRSSNLKGAVVQAEEVPLLIDEIPILAVIATQAKGRTRIMGAEELRVKESNRLRAISTELKKMGADIEETKDGLLIQGQTPLRGNQVESYSDHRMAMSLSVAGLIASGETTIRNFNCTQISFPGFLNALKQLIKK